MIGIYHHKDMDGLCCGAIMRKRYPEIRLIGYDYGEPFDMDICRGETVIMADISLPMDKMLELAAISEDFLWVDHHETAIKEYYRTSGSSENYKVGPNGMFARLDSSLSACELLWDELFPDQDMPVAVSLIGKYDTWRDSGTGFWDAVILPFQYSMRFRAANVYLFPMEVLDSSLTDLQDISEFINEGETLLQYQNQQNDYVAKRLSHDVVFDGMDCIALNTPVEASRVLRNVYDPEKHYMMICYCYDGLAWTVSLRSTRADVDCGKIAKRHGGGGHPGAAGFKTKTFPF